MRTLVAFAMMLGAAGCLFAQDSLNVRQVGFIDTPGEAAGVVVSGNYAYLAVYYVGLRVIDITNPAAPTEVGFYDTPGNAYCVAVSGSYAYVADVGGGLRVIDITNPSSPFEAGFYDTPGLARVVAVVGNYAYLADGSSGLRVIDISDPATPTEAGFYDTPGEAYGVAVLGNYAYVADANGGLRVIDIMNPAAPTEVGFYNTPGAALAVAVLGNYAYVANNYEGLRIIDISNPSSPLEVGFYDTPGAAYGLTVAGNYAYVADANGGLRVIDIMNPAAPTEVGFYNTPGGAISVAVAGNLAYVAESIPASGLGIYDISYFASQVPPCPPTPLPFIDNFDSPELDSCWTWIREDTSHWSLTERPGWMRILPRGEFHNANNVSCNNILLRPLPDTAFVLETRLDYVPVFPTGAGLVVYYDDDNFVDIVRHDGGIRSHVERGGQSQFVDFAANWPATFLRLSKYGYTYAAFASSDSLVWSRIATWVDTLAKNGTLSCGFEAIDGLSSSSTPADFDYFRVDPIDTTKRALDLYSPGYVDCGSADSVRFTNTFSIDVFAKFSSTSSQSQTMVARDGYSTNSKWVFEYNDENYAYTDNRLALHVCDRALGPVCYWACSDTWVPTIGRWYHLAVVASNRVCTFYVDGQSLGSASFPIDIPQISTPLTVGWAEGPGSYFNGELDNVRFWNRALTQQQIQQIRGCTFDSLPWLLASYHFDQQDGSTIYDSGPYGYNGTLVGNSTTWPSDTPTSDSCQFTDLQLIYPNGSEQWHVFSNDTVRWVSTGITTPMRIELNRHYPRNTWEVLADSTANDGTEAFFISDPLSDSCRVRISTVDYVYKDSSDANFSITSSQGYLALVLQSQPSTPVISWNAGTHECPETLSQTYKLKNFGSESIVVFPPALVGGVQFNLTHNCPPFFALAPGQMSTYNVTLTYDPQTEATHRDTLRMQSDAVNAVGGYVRIPMSGSQTRTPASPEVVISIHGNDAHLDWNAIGQSVGACPIDVTHYLVFYSPTMAGPFYYHGLTTDTTYVHVGVVRYGAGMFYNVIATTAPLYLLQQLPPTSENPLVTEKQVMEMLRGHTRPED